VLALSEKLPPSSDEGYRGILIHNIGFCLHCLGELESAKVRARRDPCHPRSQRHSTHAISLPIGGR
jgi:hypothetical protein